MLAQLLEDSLETAPIQQDRLHESLSCNIHETSAKELFLCTLQLSRFLSNFEMASQVACSSFLVLKIICKDFILKAFKSWNLVEDLKMHSVVVSVIVGADIYNLLDLNSWLPFTD